MIDNQKVAYQPKASVSFSSLSDLLDYIEKEAKDVKGHTIPVSDKPIGYVEYTYDGNVHTNGYTAPKGIEMVGIDKATHTGTYIAVYTPIKNYTWTDGTRTPVSVVLEIKKKELPLPYPESDLIYNGQRQKVNMINYDENIMYMTGEIAKSAGSHTATITLKDPLNYKWADHALPTVVVKWNILPAQVKVPTVVTEYVYKVNTLGIGVLQFVNADDFDEFDIAKDFEEKILS